MKKQRRRLIVFSVIVITIFIFASSAGCGSNDETLDETGHHELGLKLFQEGFYDLLPKGKTDEANQKFGQAEKAFAEAIAIKDDFVEAHRHLARVLAVQKKYSSAVNQYMRVIELDPDNMDNYLYLASVYVKMERYNDAVDILNQAKTLTKDDTAIGLIEDLIKKIGEKTK